MSSQETQRINAAYHELVKKGAYDVIDNYTTITTEGSEESLINDFVEELKIQGIVAKGKVGYLTAIETPTWTASVVDQKEISRRIITSHRTPEHLLPGADEITWRSKFQLAIKRALATPGFSNDSEFQSTREIVEYNNRIINLPLSNSPSPARLC